MGLKGELNSWQEIAGHLGINVRTAQRYEVEKGLPVRRSLDNRRAVTASVEELERWRRTVALQPDWRNNLRLLRLYSLGLTATLLVAAGGVAASRLVQRIPGEPAGFEWDDRTLVVTDGTAREIWRHFFPDPASSPRLPAVKSRPPLERRIWFGDLDGDRRRETLFSHAGRLHCFSDRGELRWHFGPKQPVYSFRVARGPGRIAVVSIGDTELASQAALLDASGRVMAEYPFASHGQQNEILETMDLDGDGADEVLLAGLDDQRSQATLVVLDQEAFSRGRERAIAWFPRTPLNKETEHFNVAYDLVALPDQTIKVQVRERARDPSPFVIYLLDRHLNVLNVDASVTMGVWNPAFSEADLEALRSQVEVLRQPMPCGNDSATAFSGWFASNSPPYRCLGGLLRSPIGLFRG